MSLVRSSASLGALTQLEMQYIALTRSPFSWVNSIVAKSPSPSISSTLGLFDFRGICFLCVKKKFYQAIAALSIKYNYEHQNFN